MTAYCLMPNHWHLLLRPRRDGELSEVMRHITVPPTQRWHAYHHTTGTGARVLGAIQIVSRADDEHRLAVARYVELNALRAKLSIGWKPGSGGVLWRREQREPDLRTQFSDWPVARPRDLGGARQSRRVEERAGSATAECAAEPAVWRGRLGPSHGETLWDKVPVAPTRSPHRLLRNDSRPLFSRPLFRRQSKGCIRDAAEEQWYR
ncbi:MAG: hypothetical protein KatS3mg082_2089 [Nitrospiraceae bacterium]|nr:MAG: hypothetical protein KatS3mg082_2089 [Nitrospiraceae bacterium]